MLTSELHASKISNLNLNYNHKEMKKEVDLLIGM